MDADFWKAVMFVVQLVVAVYAAVQSLHHIDRRNHGGAVAWAIVWFGVVFSHSAVTVNFD